MSFSISEFAKVNRVILIWTAFFALIYLMRAMFGLIFLTFVMCFIAHSLSRVLYRVTKQRRKFLVITLYLIFLSAIICFILFAFPQVIREARNFSEGLPNTVRLIRNHLDEFFRSNPAFEPYKERVKDFFSPEVLISQSFKWGRSGLEHLWKYVSWFFLAILFSFLIMMDLPNLIHKFRRLRETRLRVIYEETSSSIIRFAQVVGENFRAQIFISAINTGLTFVGLQIIGTGTTALLSIVVFCCGLIPVLGVFVSSVPIMLVALNVGAVPMVLKTLLLIVFIHSVEAYILNPRIVSSVMKINPVITLMILYIAHSLMGIWGMLLGVPISVYFFRQIKYKEDRSHNNHSGEHFNGASAPGDLCPDGGREGSGKDASETKAL
ncbi:MAG: AI-2E family transporter [Deltaproteobacteria bacterium]|jgi:predicted PurR-regulated permease PerM|nr:AI-2E family transporter [Deltaproteobacteria bacterium]